MPAANRSQLTAADLAALPLLAQHELHDEIGSTNDRALQLAADPLSRAPLLIVAHRQTAGRGRGAHRWWAAPGALTFSLLIEPDSWQLPRTHWPQLSLATAVALADVAQRHVPAAKLAVKWPNDVFVAGRKAAGILLEVPATQPQPPRRLVLGIGLNVNNSWRDAPADLAQVGTALVDHAAGPLHLPAVLADLLTAIDHRARQLAEGDPQLPARWRALCTLTGKFVAVQAGNQRSAGLCLGPADDGRLVLETSAGRHYCAAGTVVSVADDQQRSTDTQPSPDADA